MLSFNLRLQNLGSQFSQLGWNKQWVGKKKNPEQQGATRHETTEPQEWDMVGAVVGHGDSHALGHGGSHVGAMCWDAAVAGWDHGWKVAGARGSPAAAFPPKSHLGMLWPVFMAIMNMVKINACIFNVSINKGKQRLLLT